MKAEQIRVEQERIDKEFKERYGENCSSDGIVNIEKYQNSTVKILWILKEINDEDGYDQKKVLNKMVEGVLKTKSLKGSNRNGWYRTLDPIIYTSFQILNNYKNFEDRSMDYIRDNPLMVETLQKIAFMNVKKKPGGSRANYLEVAEWYKKTKELLQKQIKIINPDVIIGGNTLQLFREDFSLDFKSKDPIDFVKTKDVLWINAYHPNQTTVKRDIYCDSIMECVKSNINK